AWRGGLRLLDGTGLGRRGLGCGDLRGGGGGDGPLRGQLYALLHVVVLARLGVRRAIGGGHDAAVRDGACGDGQGIEGRACGCSDNGRGNDRRRRRLGRRRAWDCDRGAGRRDRRLIDG